MSDEKDKYPRTDKLAKDTKKPASMSDVEFFTHRNQVFRATRADSAENELVKRNEAYEAELRRREEAEDEQS